MQINHNRLADFYAPVQADNRRTTPPLPVIFEESTQGRTVTPRPERSDNTDVVIASTRSQDSQQARFIRSFLSSERHSGSDSEQPASLPRTVQEYLLINALPTQSPTKRGQFLDEMA